MTAIPFLRFFAILVTEALKMCRGHVELLVETIEAFWKWRDDRDPIERLRSRLQTRSLL